MWICDSHFTLATPYQPGVSRRSGAPWCLVSGSPLSAHARNGSPDIAFSRLRLRPNGTSILYFCVRHSTSSSPLSAPKKTNSRADAFTPAASSTFLSETPVHLPLPQRPLTGPRLPEHSKPATRSVGPSFLSSSSVSWIGLSTSPETLSFHAARSTSGC